MSLYDPADLLDVSLACVNREFPYFLQHAIEEPIDIHRPSDLHPAFFGCSDYHSAVHNHWLLIRLQRDLPDLARADEAREVLDDHLSPAKIEVERSYFDSPNNGAFSRPYGWCWVLRVHAEAATTPGDRAQQWAAGIQPLRDELATRLREYFTRILQFPIRAGLHDNSAFALTMAIDAARMIGDDALGKELGQAANRMFRGDRNYPVDFEPDGGDFLSPAITEAGLLATIQEPAEFATWLEEFLPDIANSRILSPPTFTANASDPGTVHLHGLLLTKVWSLSRIVTKLPTEDPRKTPLTQAAIRHWNEAQSALDDRHYHATHWMPTFTVLAHDAARDAGFDIT